MCAYARHSNLDIFILHILYKLEVDHGELDKYDTHTQAHTYTHTDTNTLRDKVGKQNILRF